MEIFQQGETVEVLVYVYTQADAFVNQDNLKVTINDPDGTEVLAEVAMGHDGTGIYSYNYTLSATATTGIYMVKIKATNGTNYTIDNDQFKVVTAI